jgi:hypothetical protein
MSKLRDDENFATQFILCLGELADSYPTENVLISWGNDFAFF